MSGVLEGVRVLDLTTIVMGPFATRLLADLGADVIKIEPPEGDPIRHNGPARSPGMSGFFLNLNRRKRSIVLDLKKKPARRALDSLVATSDVFVTNVRTPALRTLGLTPERLREVRQDLIYCQARGYSSLGPNADEPAYDDVIQAATGLAALPMVHDREPALVPSLICDKVAALHVAVAVIAALHHRSRTGQGNDVEVPMAEVLASFNLLEYLGGHTFKPPIGSFGYRRVAASNHGPQRSSDGWVCVMPYTEAHWRDILREIGRGDLVGDSRLSSAAWRSEHVEELNGILLDAIANETTETWLAKCRRLSVPAAPVLGLDEIANDPRSLATRFIETMHHPTEGSYRWVADPISFSTPSAAVGHAPLLGEHGREVLQEAGLSDAEISAALGPNELRM